MDFDYQLIVIGGGCNGTGIARDAALRGIRTLLVEKEDFAMGATGASSRMIHGGARYLLFDRKTTELSCLDSGYIQNIAPHLLFRIPFLVPYLEHRRGNPAKKYFMNVIYPLLMEAYFRGYDRYQPLKNGKLHTRLSREEVQQLEPGLSLDVLGAMTMDEWGIDPWRLCVLNAKSAHQHGATILNAHRVESLLRRPGGRVYGVVLRDQITGQRKEATAAVVFNATGAWTPGIAKMADATVDVRPGKGTHLVLDRRISNWGISVKAVDGRDIIFWPDQNTTLIGTTDDDFYGNPDEVQPSYDEVRYLMQAVERVFPPIRRARVIRAFSGLRPTIFAWGKSEDKLSRHHKVYDHSREGAPGLLSIAGGKLASYRLMAEEATDRIAQVLGEVRASCSTHLQPLPGGSAVPSQEELSRGFEGIEPYAASRLLFRHGSIAREILEEGSKEAFGNAIVCSCEAVAQSELKYAIRHEFVRKPSDLCRRTRLGLGPCNGMRCARAAARIYTRTKALDGTAQSDADTDVQKAYEDIQAYLWKQQAPVLQDATLRQAALDFQNNHKEPS